MTGGAACRAGNGAVAMDRNTTAGKTRIELDARGLAAVERLVAYETGNALLMMNLSLQQRFDLRAEEYQVFMLIVLSTVQRFVRDDHADMAHLGNAPLPQRLSGGISRRRISETLGIPPETARRIAALLLERGMIVERRRGCLSTAGGTLGVLSADAVPEKIASGFLKVASTMLRLGAARLAGQS